MCIFVNIGRLAFHSGDFLLRESLTNGPKEQKGGAHARQILDPRNFLVEPDVGRGQAHQFNHRFAIDSVSGQALGRNRLSSENMYAIDAGGFLRTPLVISLYGSSKATLLATAINGFKWSRFK